MRPDYWLLPDGMDEVLPPDSTVIEQLKTEVLALFDLWGYELVSPPLVEYIDALLIGAGNDLDLQTFKLIDQISGRTLGIRCDITPQIARIDAHQLKRSVPSRYCYAGTVLRTRSNDFASSRNPFQIGAELFGHQGAESDVEVMELMLRSLQLAGINDVYLDIGHVGIYRNLAKAADLSSHDEQMFFAALQRKDLPEIKYLLQQWQLDAAIDKALAELAMLSGGEEVISLAEKQLLPLNISGIEIALKELRHIQDQLRLRMPVTKLHFDLSELRGYNYKTGSVFAAFVPGIGREIARGGRYDDIGKVFGQGRPATGFSADLKSWAELSTRNWQTDKISIFAPYKVDPLLQQAIQRLRDEGKRVIQQLPGQAENAAEQGCDQILVFRNNQWEVASIESIN